MVNDTKKLTAVYTIAEQLLSMHKLLDKGDSNTHLASIFKRLDATMSNKTEFVRGQMIMVTNDLSRPFTPDTYIDMHLVDRSYNCTSGYWVHARALTEAETQLILGL